jgi:hypothetical protein
MRKLALTALLAYLFFIPSLAVGQSAPVLHPDYGKLPLSFEANQGQTAPQVKFTSRGEGYSLFLTNSAAVLSLSHRAPEVAAKRPKTGRTDRMPTESDVIRMELAGANSGMRVEGADQLPGKVNYFIGNDPAKWRSDVPTYARVRYTTVYPGVDLVYYGNQHQLEYDFIVAPGADPRSIRLHFAGADKLLLTPAGDLSVIAPHGTVSFHKPVIYQTIGGRRQPVDGRFTLSANNAVGFRLGRYDASQPVTIDPTLAYSTYLGGSQQDQIQGLAVDASGNAYVAGSTSSTDFPVVQNDYQTVKKSYATAGFIAKFNAAGSALTYCTYLSGSSPTYLTAIAVDTSGNAYVTGYTTSTDYPTTAGAYQARNNANQASIVTKLNASGSGLVFSTYLSGNNTDLGTSIATDSSGGVYVAGATNSTTFPTTTGAFQLTNKTANTNQTGFISKLNASGTGLIYSTYLGASKRDYVNAIALDIAGSVYATGGTYSTDFPVTTNPYQLNNKTNGSYTAFVSKLNASGTGLLYSTYLGGTNAEQGNAIAVDGTGEAFVAGSANSSNFPVTTGAYVTKCVGGESFVTKFNASGNGLVYSTCFGPNGNTSISAIALDSAGNAYLTGTTGDTLFPVSTGAFQSVRPQYNGSSGFLTVLNASGTNYIYSTYYAGGSNDQPSAIALDSSGNVYLAGYTHSTDFPVTTGAFQTKFKQNAYINSFAGKFGAVVQTAATPTFSPAAGTFSATQTITISDSTQGATIYYTTDSSTPTTSSLKYTAPIAVASTETIQAIAIASGYTNSAVASASYTISPVAATPTFTPPGGTYSSTQTVSIGDKTTGASIYYTTDGATPTTSSTKYVSAITVSASETIQAIAAAPGYTNSAVAAAVYTIGQVQTAPGVSLALSSSTITTAQPLTATVTVAGSAGKTPTGSVTLTSYNYASASATLSNGTASISIPAGTLSTGVLTITATYTPDAASSSSYTSGSGTATVTVTTAVTPALTVSGTAVTVKAGATQGNTSTITVTPGNGFTGNVALTAAVTSGPTGASNVPTVSFGSTSPANITGTSAGTATLTISTTAPKTSSLSMPQGFGTSSKVALAGIPLVASLLLLFIPRRKSHLLRLGALLFAMGLAFGVTGCGGSGGGGSTTTSTSPGTTTGAYTVTITATSGSTSTTGTVTVTVQ